ncbi:kinase-like domain-containing protein [Lasiosphaeria ovina]|uniref:Kinase-like domain-containing protein n=1 Tax=Lasiosphaeria ovina TaxID=92902 RepID=A0AAE0K6S2_9PEZI|nr:kinase-like domain-containing protein [Lasiosphaeria ovina]
MSADGDASLTAKPLESIYDRAVAELEALFETGILTKLASGSDIRKAADDTLFRLRLWGKGLQPTPDWGNTLTAHYPDEASGLQFLLGNTVSAVRQIAASSSSSSDDSLEEMIADLKSSVDNLSEVSGSIHTLLGLATGRGTAYTVRTSVNQRGREMSPTIPGGPPFASEILTHNPVAQVPGPPSVVDNFSDSGNSSEAEQSSYFVSTKGYTETNPSSFPEHETEEGTLATDNGRDANEPLEGRIYSELRGAYREIKGFIPRNRLDVIITEESVSRELEMDDVLKHFPVGRRAALARQICQVQIRRAQKVHGDNDEVPPAITTTSFRKIFAILVLIYQVDKIIHFLEENVNDSDLPLVMYSYNKPGGQFTLRRRTNSDPPLQCFDGWRFGYVRQFEEWQWSMVAPFFSKQRPGNVSFYQLEDKVVLPFIHDSSRHESLNDEDVHQGGFSDVFRVQIHPGHHNFHGLDGSLQEFAVKQLHSKSRDEFKREVEMLKRFSGTVSDPGSHLISLLATYEQSGNFYLIFPWAQADLSHYWMVNNASPNFDEYVYWVADQCLGLANGLRLIHSYGMAEPPEESPPSSTDIRNLSNAVSTSLRLDPGSGQQLITNESADKPCQYLSRHGDIKPENILWFNDPSDPNDQGTLKITDFGVSELETRLLTNTTNSVLFTPAYRPPEMDVKGAAIGQAADIWSLGCVYLEFVSWLLGGFSYVQEFAKRKSAGGGLDASVFFEVLGITSTEAKGYAVLVKPAVIEWIDHLHSNPACTEFVHSFLDVIRFRLLVVDSTKRATSSAVCDWLQKMEERCHTDANYALAPALADSDDDTMFKLTAMEVESMRARQLRVYTGQIARRSQRRTLTKSEVASWKDQVKPQEKE